MNKVVKIIIGLLVVCVLVAVVIFAVSSRDNSEEVNNESVADNSENGENIENEVEGETDVASSDTNILVVYFSAQNHTEAVAEKIAEVLNADVFEIMPVDEYTEDDLDWTDDESRVSLEHEDSSLQDVELISTEVENWDDYDTVFIGYPIWWGSYAWPITNFVEDNDFTGKTVIPFCTSSSSSIGQSDEELAELAGTGDWLDGQRFSSNVSDSDVEEWIESLQLD